LYTGKPELSKEVVFSKKNERSTMSYAKFHKAFIVSLLETLPMIPIY